MDADYKFTYIDVSNYGRIADGGVFNNSTLYISLEPESLHLPPSQPLPGREQAVPFTMVADEAFPLKPNIMKPYSARMLNKEQRLYNYRLSRARRIVENVFGILANRFGIFKKTIPLAPDKVVKIVLATCALHNFLRTKSTARNAYMPASLIDREEDGQWIKGSWRSDVDP